MLSIDNYGKSHIVGLVLNKAIIPLGGLGTRLYPLTVDTSKAMIRFLNRPLIDFTIMKLARQGIREFYLGVSGYVNYIGLFDHLGSGEGVTHKLGLTYEEVRIRYQPNVVTRGNAESVKIVMEYYDLRDPVLVVQGDIVFDISLSDLWNYHVSKDAYMTIVLRELEDLSRLRLYGVAKLGDGGLIEGFIEKPTNPSEAPSNLINTGIYLLSPEFRDFFNTDVGRSLYDSGNLDFGRHVIPALIKCKYPIYGYITRSYWFDVGTPESYLEACKYLLRSLSNEELEVSTTYNGIKFMGKTLMSKALHRSIIDRLRSNDLSIEGDVLLGRHIFLGRKVRVVNSVIDHYVIVGNESLIEDSVIMDRCNIGSNVVIVNSIIGRHAVIGDNVVVRDSVLGNGVVVGDGSIITNSKIWPHKIIPGSTAIKDSILT